MEIRAAKGEDFDNVIELINHVFRTTRGHKPTMQQEFPLLLNVDNVDQMIGAYIDEKPVSEVNFLKEKILIDGVEVLGASIGGVCTHEDFRKKNYVSIVLDKVEENMLHDGVDFVLISGDRSLYTRRGCAKVRNFYRYEIGNEELIIDSEEVRVKSEELKKENEELRINNEKLTVNGEKVEKYVHKLEGNGDELGIKIEELVEDGQEGAGEKILGEMISMYNSNSTRYYRTYEEFKSLLHSATIPWGDFSYKKYIIKKGEEFKGYIILRIIDVNENECVSENKNENENESRNENRSGNESGNGRHGQVIEVGGNPRLIGECLIKLVQHLNLKYINHYVHEKDKLNMLERYSSKEQDYLHGTVKIINFQGFMKKLMPYFAQHVEKQVLNNIEFYIEYKEEEKGEVFDSKDSKDAALNDKTLNDKTLNDKTLNNENNKSKFIIKLGDEKLTIDSIELATKLVFEGINKGISKGGNLPKDIDNSPNIKSFVQKVFPIPFPWTANLNYQ